MLSCCYVCFPGKVHFAQILMYKLSFTTDALCIKINTQILSIRPFWVLRKHHFYFYSYKLISVFPIVPAWKLGTWWSCFIFLKYLFWKIAFCKIPLSDTVVLPLSQVLSDKSGCQFCYCERLMILTAFMCLLWNVNNNVQGWSFIKGKILSLQSLINVKYMLF